MSFSARRRLRGGNGFEAAGVSAASSAGTTLTAGAVNTKGSYTELIASTAYPACGVVLSVGLAQNVNAHAIDLAIGAAASEVIVVPDIFVHVLNTRGGRFSVYLPIALPAGVRLSARTQCATASQTIVVAATLIAQAPGIPVAGRATAYGITTSGATAGTSVDAGASANTEGAIAELVASTANPIHQIVVLLGDASVGAATAHLLLDILVGGSGSEQVLIPDLSVTRHVSYGPPQPHVFGPFPVNLPAGVRLSARAQASSNDATMRLLRVALLGFD